ncbi:MAG: nitroreductase family protein, partial [Candidatus Thermoplasmatota archaeon]
KNEIKDFCEETDRESFEDSPDWFKKWMEDKNISLDKNFLVDAPYLAVVCGEQDKPYWLESTWLAIGFIVLAAEYEGLSTLTYTPSSFEGVKKILEIPEKIQPVVILPLGFSKD